MRRRIGVNGHEKWSEKANQDEEADDRAANRYLTADRHRSPDSQQHIQHANMEWITRQELNRGNAGRRYFLGLHGYALLSWRTRGSRTVYNISARKFAPSTARVMIRKMLCIIA